MKVESATLNSEDVLVFTRDDYLTKDQFTEFRNAIKGNLDRVGLSDVKFIALDRSTDLKVLSVGRSPIGILSVDRPISAEQFATMRFMVDKQIQERLANGYSMRIDPQAGGGEIDPSGFNMTDFDVCARRDSNDTLELVKGKDCYIGIDCGYGDVDSRDRAAVLIFPNMPSTDCVTALTRSLSGYSAADIVAWIEKATEQFSVKGIGVDPAYNRELLGIFNIAEFPVASVPQGWTTMAPVTKWLEEKMASDRFVHFANPMYRSAFSNAVFHTDSAGNRVPHKGKSRGPIGYVCATLNAAALFAAKE